MVQNYNLGGDDETLRRQQALADMLRQQSMTPLPAASYRVSPLEGLAKMLQAYSARKWDDVNDQTRQANTQRNQADMSQFVKLLRGAPAVNPLTPNDDEGNPMPQVSPAQEPDLAGAMEFAMQSKSPQLQALSQQLMGAQIASAMPKTPKWEKFEMPKGDGTSEVGFVDVNNPNPISTFQRGGTSPVKGVAVNGRMVNPVSGQPIGKEIPKQIAPDSVVTVDPVTGKIVPNSPVIEAKKAIAKSGASNVSVNTATKPFLSEIGKGAGEAVNNAFAGAQSAVQTLNNVQQIEDGLKNVIVGTGANARLKLAQIGQTLGITGKNTEEQLQNTRNVMQGLARQELAAAGQMKGQGQITESERAILRKAESGDIGELTVPEIQTLTTALKKTANYRIQAHQANMQRLRNDPNAAGVVDFMQIQPPMASSSLTPQEQAELQQLRARFGR